MKNNAIPCKPVPCLQGLLVYLLTTKEPPASSAEGLSDFGLEGDGAGARGAEKPVLVSGPGKALSLAGRDVSR